MTIVKSKTKLRKSTTSKKRLGEHHRTGSRNYLKTYWPYLPMLMILAVCFLLSNTLTSHPSVLGVSSDLSAQSFLSATNAERSKVGDSTLVINPTLSQAAQNKANDMAKMNFWAHNSPSGETPWQYINGAGYNYQQAGENLAYGFSNSSDVISAWMNSSEHRMNILNSNYQEVGFGVASSINFINQGAETIVVAEYAEPAQSGSVANISFSVNPRNGVKGASNEIQTVAPKASLVSRIQVLTNGQASWSLLAASFLTGALVFYFVIRNLKRIKRIVRNGEKFASKHLILDIVLVLAIGVGYILTRTSGFIH